MLNLERGNCSKKSMLLGIVERMEMSDKGDIMIIEKDKLGDC